jgi:hypothetical protein
MPPEDKTVADARRAIAAREQGYREQALKMYPWVCGRCTREFTRANLSQLTVHHRDHNHDYNPPDGSNWELLCLYCHDHEHAKYVHQDGNATVKPGDNGPALAKHKPFAALAGLLGKPE